MTEEELEELKKLNTIQLCGLFRRNPDIKRKCLEHLSFLDHEPDNKEIYLYIQNGKREQARCCICDKLIVIKRRGGTGKINKTCSAACSIKIVNPETGMTVAQESALKAAATYKNAIDPETGERKSVIGAIKAATTCKKLDKNGKTIRENATDKMVITKTTTITANGKTISQNAANLAVLTKNNTIDENGLNTHQRAIIKSMDTVNHVGPDGETISKKKSKKMGETFFKKLIEKQNNRGYEILTPFDEYYDDDKKFLTFKHIECGTIGKAYKTCIRCVKCFPYNKSICENEILSFCSDVFVGGEVSSNNRQTIPPYELDIIIPECRLAIEYNGVYWHSHNNVEDELENKNYHLEKTLKCEEKGLNLLHIFENEWIDDTKRSVWESIIRNKLGKSNKIYARKCVIQDVSSKASKEFLENNHLQGNAPASIRYGLYYDGDLVALMTFSKSRFNKKIDWELIRYCNMLNTSVIGGASRLFKHFLKNHTGSIISYADRRHSQGGLYKNLGFEFSHNSDPNYFYYDKNKQPYILESRQKYQKHKLPALLENFDPDMTETENMYKHGYRKIYDCGNQVWVYER
jgi:G:T-mismatch repair DNA endonuclease (very short patch repair protein)